MEGLDRLCINTLRFLGVDMVENARSRHPGMPLGAAPMAYVLWDRFLKHNPADPAWPGRDRFVLSAGHGSALLYALLRLSGYPLPMDELRRFRQWGSKTPGAWPDPWRGGHHRALGAGAGHGRVLPGRALRPPRPPHRGPFHLCDGLRRRPAEGVAAEAASLAGTLGLGKLACLYDDHHISIEGTAPSTSRWSTWPHCGPSHI